MAEDEDILAAQEYADNRYDKFGLYWDVAKEAFLAGVKWRGERRDIGE